MIISSLLLALATETTLAHIFYIWSSGEWDGRVIANELSAYGGIHYVELRIVSGESVLALLRSVALVNAALLVCFKPFLKKYQEIMYYLG